MTLTKMDLVNSIHCKIGLSNQEAHQMVDFVFRKIITSLESGQAVKLSSFGQFSIRDKNARIGRNPKTGEEKIIPARRVVTFKASPKLKKRLNHPS